MARYYGKVGFGQTIEVRPGVWEDVITERNLYGDVLNPSRSFSTEEKVNRDARLGNRLSLMASDEITANIDAIRYVEYKGNLWYVSKIEDKPPRLILSMGEVYNGPTPNSGST